MADTLGPSQPADDPSLPVRFIPGEGPLDPPREGIALCLSGGGYRAMLFHLGTLWRLNELKMLPKLDRVSSVSGGSITAAVLGLAWDDAQWVDEVNTAFVDTVVAPIRRLASRTIDVGSVLGGVFLPGSVSDKVTGAYRKYLYGDATLQNLPDRPRFVINATSVQTGALFRFSKPYMADYLVGRVVNPDVLLATAVAASSAFPPVLSPLVLDLDPDKVEPMKGTDLHRPPYTDTAVLTDGGVYDNLGLETAWKSYRTVLVSDGGGKLGPEAEPKGDWARHALRVNELIDNQVRSLRKRQLIDSFKLMRVPTGNGPHAAARSGAYWGIRSQLGHYPTRLPLGPDTNKKTLALANTPTRLKRLEPELQEALTNWGYAVCDAGMRSWVTLDAPAPGGLPYPEIGLGG